jgi:uncharacterized delta-60 repeat protein
MSRRLDCRSLTNAVFQTLERRQLLAIVAPDVSWGDGGRVNVPSNDLFRQLPDGTTYALGTWRRPNDDFGSGDSNGSAALLTKLRADGTIDTAFGTNGSLDLAEAGKSLVVGDRLYVLTDNIRPADPNAAQEDNILALTLQGTTDTSFGGGDGLVTLQPTVTGSFSSWTSRVRRMLPAPGGDGFLVQLSTTFVTQRSGQPISFIEREEFVKLTTTGTIDSSFGTAGRLIFNDSATTPTQLLIGQDAIYRLINRYSRIDNTTSVTLTRYNPSGTAIDSSFGTRGEATLPQRAEQIALQPDGKILFTAPDADGLFLYRLNRSGTPDTAFGSGGKIQLRRSTNFIDPPDSYLLDSQQRIYTLSEGRLQRYSPAGVLDTQLTLGSRPIAGRLTGFDNTGRLLVNDRVPAFNRTPGYEYTLALDLDADAIALGRNRTLYLFGDNTAETASIGNISGNRIRVTVGSTTRTFNASQISGLSVDLAAGDDSLSLTTGKPGVVFTGLGDDRVYFDQGNLDLDLGDGNDSLEMAQLTADGPVTASGGVGDDRITYASALFGGPATLRGGDGNDIIAGSLDVQRIEGDAGDDTLIGGESSDILIGGTDRDSLVGDGGNDRLFGDEGNDVLDGRSGNDLVTGGDGDDLLLGEAGRDRLFGEAGNDNLQGGSGDDFLAGGAGNDRLYSQGGSDELRGEGGSDRLYADYNSTSVTLRGGTGNDRFTTRDNASQQIFGDTGTDTATTDNLDLLRDVEVVG